MVAIGIIDFAAAPPIGVLAPYVDENGPYGAGNHSLTTWKSGGITLPTSGTFGVVVQLSGSAPPYFGRSFGFDDGASVVLDEYDERLLQLAALHQFLGGAWVATQVHDIHYLPYLTRWSEALPGKIGLYVAPSVSVDLYFLLV